MPSRSGKGVVHVFDPAGRSESEKRAQNVLLATREEPKCRLQCANGHRGQLTGPVEAVRGAIVAEP